MTRLSVIICTYNRDKYLPAALQSLSDQTADKSVYEVILIDNNSTDKTAGICKVFANENPEIKFRYFVEKAQGLSHARNRGINETKSSLISFIDDDAIASSEYCDEVIGFFSTFGDAGAMGGKILPKYETVKPAWISRYLKPLFSVIDLGDKVVLFNKGKYPIGANMSFRSEIFNKIGLFNTSLGRSGRNLIGGEEKDIFFRIKQASVKIYYAPNPWVYHMVTEERTKIDFIRQQAFGIGLSEKLRIRDNFTLTSSRYFIELFKWGASIMLFFYYSFGFSLPKGLMIVRFRAWVTKGLLLGKT